MNKPNDHDAQVTTINDNNLAERAISLGERAIGFIEKHPAIPIITVALGAFCSMGKTAIKAGWTPDQMAELGKSFPVQISIPALNI